MEDLRVKRTESPKFNPVSVPRGIYPATIDSVRKIVVQNRDTFVFSFQITGGPDTGKIVDGLTSTILSDKSKLFKWVESIDRLLLPRIGEQLDVSLLVNKKCRIIADDRERPDSENRMQRSSFVKDVLPYE